MCFHRAVRALLQAHITRHEALKAFLRCGVFAFSMLQHCLRIVAIQRLLIFEGTYELVFIFLLCVALSLSLSLIIQTQNRCKLFILCCLNTPREIYVLHLLLFGRIQQEIEGEASGGLGERISHK